MSDLIDRQEAISRAVELRMYGKPVKMVEVSALESLPSVRAEHGENSLPEQADLDRLGVNTGETCADTISRQAAIDAMCELMHHWFGGNPKDEIREIKRELEKLPSAQSIPTKTEDLIRRGDAIEAIYRRIKQLGLEYDADVLSIRQAVREVPSTQPSGKDPIEREAVVDILHDAMPGCSESEENLIGEIVCKVDLLPSAQPEKRTEERTETHACDCISRQAAIDAISCDITVTGRQNAELVAATIGTFADRIKALPSAQPERTCVNCGRTINNGGWYADGRTRCPIEEHYALPKDGYCHLWEKRNVTDDDYAERREE